MKRSTTLSILFVTLFTGCAAQQIEQLKTDEQTAERIYTATTQATAAVKATLTTQPVNADAVKVITAAEKGEQTARLALDLARAALIAAQNNDASDPSLHATLAAAISAIPSPWTPILASLIPAAIPLAFSIVQSVKLGRAHETVLTVTKQLEAHQAALQSLTNKPAVT